MQIVYSYVETFVSQNIHKNGQLATKNIFETYYSPHSTYDGLAAWLQWWQAPFLKIVS